MDGVYSPPPLDNRYRKKHRGNEKNASGSASGSDVEGSIAPSNLNHGLGKAAYLNERIPAPLDHDKTRGKGSSTALPSRSRAPPPPTIPVPKPRTPVIRMEPDCAICHAPAAVSCDCEKNALDSTLRLAESRMMATIYSDIRTWVRAHAQDYIIEHFRVLAEQRKAAHQSHLENITTHAYRYYHAPPHPNEIFAAQVQLKRGIDEDWATSVQLYPEIMEYCFSLVELTLPDDSDLTIDPVLSVRKGVTKVSIPKERRRAADSRSTVSSSKSVASTRFSDTSTLYEPSLLGSIDEERQLDGNKDSPRNRKFSLRSRQTVSKNVEGVSPYPARLREKLNQFLESEGLRVDVVPKMEPVRETDKEQWVPVIETAMPERSRGDESPARLSEDEGSPMEEDCDPADSEFSWSNMSEEAPDTDKSHPIFQLRGEYLQVVIGAYDQTQKNSGNVAPASNGVTSTSSTSPSRGRDLSNKDSSRKHGRSTDSTSEGGEKISSRASNKRRALAHELSFACPFAKKDSIKHRDCYRYFLTRIRDVKQHLKRCHRMPIHCPRCAEIFSDEDDRDEHLRSANCTVRPLLQIDGISEKQQKLLSQRISSRMTEDEQWFTVFEILFPGHPLPRSPYIDRELSEQMQIFRDFLVIQGRTLLSEFLDSRATITWRVPPGESDLAAFQDNILADALLVIFDRFTSSSTATETASSTASASCTISQSAGSRSDMRPSRERTPETEFGLVDTTKVSSSGKSVEALTLIAPSIGGSSTMADESLLEGLGQEAQFFSLEPSQLTRGKEKSRIEPLQDDMRALRNHIASGEDNWLGAPHHSTQDYGSLQPLGDLEQPEFSDLFGLELNWQTNNASE